MTSRPESRALATEVVHGARTAGPRDPVVTPLVQSANFVSDAAADPDALPYPRYGNTPNADLVQRRLAVLEGADAALVLSSGMGAIACALLALLRPGDHLLASEWLYGGARRLLEEELAAFGIATTFVDPSYARRWRQQVRARTRAIFVETPTNPVCRVVDLKPLSALAKDSGLAFVVDSTFASPVNLRPLEHGADVVIHSGTKYLNGHNDVLAGVVAGTAPYVEEVRRKMMLWGQAPDPFACWLLERGLKTLDVRVRRQNDNALRVALWCATQPAIRAVHYAGLPSHPDHDVAASQMDGFGGMLAFELAAGAAGTERFLARLQLITPAPSLGGVETIISEPRRTSHAHLSAEQRAAAGIPDGLLRLSVGVEDPDDLIADLAQALA